MLPRTFIGTTPEAAAGSHAGQEGKRRPRYMGRAFVVVAASCFVAACSRDRSSGPLVISGHIEARDVRVSTKVAGRLDSLLLDEGDTLAAGQAIASMDDTDARLTLDIARAELAEARAQLDLLLAGSRDEDIAEARASSEAARVELVHANLELDRMQALLIDGTVSPKTRDDAAARRDIAARQLDAASQRLARVRAGSRPEEIATARAHLETSEARLRQAEQQLADTRLTSPVAGIVTEKLVEAGDRMARDAVLAVVTELGAPWLTAWVGESDLARIRLGQRAEVATDGGARREGKVTWISPRAEFTPKNVQTRDEREKLVYRVKITLPNDDLLFKPGMPAEATLLPDVATP